MSTPLQLCLIAVGGALGALTRYGVGLIISQRLGVTFPWGTFVINASGSLLLGFIYELFGPMTTTGSYIRPLVGIGFIGAYTTFSTFEYESAQLGSSWRAMFNLMGSVIVGYGCVWIGIKLGAIVGQAFGLIPRV
jgi:CrcB protein